MSAHDRLQGVTRTAAAAVMLSTIAESIGQSGVASVVGANVAGPIGAVLAGAASLSGNWLTNRWHDSSRNLAAEFNDPTKTQRNHFLRRVVSKAIALGIEAAAEEAGRATHTGRGLLALALKASAG
jgi:hypothetical protein